MSPPTTNPDPMMQSMWTPTASTVLPAHGIVGQFCGGDPQVNQQAQSQAQISALQHQNALLNQQLATQAASHIHQLQQVLRPSSSVPNPQTPAPSEPPQPTVQPEVKTTTPPPVHTDEMLQKLRTDCKAGMENILQKFHDSSEFLSFRRNRSSSVPQPSSIPRSPVPARRSRSPAPQQGPPP